MKYKIKTTQEELHANLKMLGDIDNEVNEIIKEQKKTTQEELHANLTVHFKGVDIKHPINQKDKTISQLKKALK